MAAFLVLSDIMHIWYTYCMFVTPFSATLNVNMLSPKTHLRWFTLALNELWIRDHRINWINWRKWIAAYLSLCSPTHKQQNDYDSLSLTHVTLLAFPLADTCCAHLIGMTFICAIVPASNMLRVMLSH